MKQIVTLGSVLHRINYGEADKILTILTLDQGKVSVLAKGVRREKSKLAGGVELFSESDLTLIFGRGEIKTLISSRMRHHYSKIATDIDRATTGYEVLKNIDRFTQEACGPEYYKLLHQMLENLNNLDVALVYSRLWFYVQLLIISGHSLNLSYQANSKKFEAEEQFEFSNEKMGFFASQNGNYNQKHLKLMRLATNNSPEKLVKIQNSGQLAEDCVLLLSAVVKQYYQRPNIDK